LYGPIEFDIYWWIQDTIVSGIVCFTILVLPILLDDEYRKFSIVYIQYWIYQYRAFTILEYIHNTGISSIPHPAIHIMFQNGSQDRFRKQLYWYQLVVKRFNSPHNTRFFSNLVCFTILVLPVLLDEEYWSFRYCVYIPVL
jgi:hypothetical protein